MNVAASPAAVSAGRKLVIICAQALVAGSLAAGLEASGAWSVEVLPHDHRHLLSRCRAARPDLVLIAVDEDFLSWMDVLSTCVGAIPDVSVMVVGDLPPTAATEAVARGARGFMSYSASLDDLRSSIDTVCRGGTVVAGADLTRIIDRLADMPAPRPSSRPQLSQRELEVLRRVAAGESTGEIAEALGIEPPTVRKHVQNVLAKLGLHSKLQAAAYAARRGLV